MTKGEQKMVDICKGTLGRLDKSPCLQGWIDAFARRYMNQEGYELKSAGVEAMLHTLVAQKYRIERLIRERDEARELLEDKRAVLKKELDEFWYGRKPYHRANSPEEIARVWLDITEKCKPIVEDEDWSIEGLREFWKRIDYMNPQTYIETVPRFYAHYENFVGQWSIYEKMATREHPARVPRVIASGITNERWVAKLVRYMNSLPSEQIPGDLNEEAERP